jgi:hypothetical protein
MILDWLSPVFYAIPEPMQPQQALSREVHLPRVPPYQLAKALLRARLAVGFEQFVVSRPDHQCFSVCRLLPAEGGAATCNPRLPGVPDLPRKLVQVECDWLGGSPRPRAGRKARDSQTADQKGGGEARG